MRAGKLRPAPTTQAGAQSTDRSIFVGKNVTTAYIVLMIVDRTPYGGRQCVSL